MMMEACEEAGEKRMLNDKKPVEGQAEANWQTVSEYTNERERERERERGGTKWPEEENGGRNRCFDIRLMAMMSKDKEQRRVESLRMFVKFKR
jgi:hypothetical protein